MTNLVEKALLLGFSIFLLTIFSSLLAPILNEINDFNRNDKNSLNSYLDFYEEMDLAVNFIINNPSKSYQKDVYYPKDLNITIIDTFIIYEFQFRDENFSYALAYNQSFINRVFYNIPPQIYLLNVSYLSSKIMINLFEYN